jgi:hypothetical protein
MSSKERRIRERRCYQRITRFPLTDRSGCVVLFNRSSQPDRRLGNFRVRLVQLDDPKQ